MALAINLIVTILLIGCGLLCILGVPNVQNICITIVLLVCLGITTVSMKTLIEMEWDSYKSINKKVPMGLKIVHITAAIVLIVLEIIFIGLCFGHIWKG